MGKGKKPKPGRKPEFDSRQTPPKPIHTKVVVSFELYEHGGPYCLCHCDPDQTRTYLSCFRQLTSRTWQQLREGGTKDPTAKTGLNPTRYTVTDLKGVECPAQLSRDVTLLGVRASARMRLFGATVEGVFYVLWFDRDHEIVPV